MKAFAWNTLLYGLPLAVVLAGTSHWQYHRGYEAGQASLRVAKAEPDVNAVCVAWLLETNLQEAKEKICGKKQKRVAVLSIGDQTTERKRP